MPFPIGWIAGWLLKRTGLGETGAKVAAWVIAAVVLSIAAAIGWSLLKGAILDDYKTEQRAKSAEAALEQTNKADKADAKLEARDDAATDALEEGARNAASSDPEGAAEPVGPVSRNVHDGLRNNRRPSPSGD
jgi:cytoskeletal protein RodZ